MLYKELLCCGILLVMEKIDIQNALGVNMLSDLHLGLSLDDLLAVSLDAKIIALSGLRLKHPDMFASVELIHRYTAAAAVGLLIAATVEGGAGTVVDVLTRQGLPGEEQAESLLCAYSLYVACYRLQEVADWSSNSFSEALERGDFTEDGFKWFYLLHLGRMALKGRRSYEPARIGRNLSLFNGAEHMPDLLDSLQALQAFVRDYPKELLKHVGSEPFKAVLSYLRELGAEGHLSVEFEDDERVLRLYR